MASYLCCAILKLSRQQREIKMNIFNSFMLNRYVETKDNEYFDRKDAQEVVKDIELPAYKFSWRDLFWVSSADNIYKNDGTR